MHTGAIRKLDVSADGTLIATASDDKTARLWSVPERRLLKTFRLSIPELTGGRQNAGDDQIWRGTAFLHCRAEVSAGISPLRSPIRLVDRANDITSSYHQFKGSRSREIPRQEAENHHRRQVQAH